MLRYVIIFLLGSMLVLCGAQRSPAQDSQPNDNPAYGVSYEDGEVTYWEFGLRIKSSSNSTGITATVPIPISWPEQTVSVIAENKTDNLRKLTYKKLAGDVQQLVIRATKLNAGETAEASVILRVDKRHINSPVDITKLQFASKVPSKLRQYLRPSPYIESNHKRIKEIAAELTFDDSIPAFKQVEKIYRWVRDKIEYQERDEMKTCLESLDSGTGDCFELSSLFIAICRARKIPARAVWIPGHMYPEFYLEDELGNGHWIPCQAAGDFSFGDMIESRPIVQKGDNFKLPQEKKRVRFVMPRLRADNAGPNGLAIEFINRQLTKQEAAATGR